MSEEKNEIYVDNVKTLNLDSYKSMIIKMLEAKVRAMSMGDKLYNPNLFVFGPPGIGKSEVIKQICKEHDIGLSDVRCSQLDPTDLRGLPVFNYGEARFVPYSDLLPFNDDIQRDWSIPENGKIEISKYKLSIIFLDEMLHANDMVQSACYQLINDRCIGEYKVPDYSIIIAASNEEEHGGVYNEMPGPLKDRFAFAKLGVDNKGFLKYMNSKGYDYDILSFLNAYIEIDDKILYNYKPERNVFPTHRSWERCCANIMYGMNKHDAIEISLGRHVLSEFINFEEIASEIPSAKELVNGKIYFNGVWKKKTDSDLNLQPIRRFVAAQRVGSYLTDIEKLKELKGDEPYEFLEYFIDMVDENGEKRDEVAISILNGIKLHINDLIEKIKPGFQKAKKEKKSYLMNIHEVIDGESTHIPIERLTSAKFLTCYWECLGMMK